MTDSGTAQLNSQGGVNKVRVADVEAPQASHDQKHGQGVGHDAVTPHHQDPTSHSIAAREAEKEKSTDQELLEAGTPAQGVGNAKFEASLKEAEGKTVI